MIGEIRDLHKAVTEVSQRVARAVEGLQSSPGDALELFGPQVPAKKGSAWAPAIEELCAQTGSLVEIASQAAEDCARRQSRGSEAKAVNTSPREEPLIIYIYIYVYTYYRERYLFIYIIIIIILLLLLLYV